MLKVRLEGQQDMAYEWGKASLYSVVALLRVEANFPTRFVPPLWYLSRRTARHLPATILTYNFGSLAYDSQVRICI